MLNVPAGTLFSWDKGFDENMNALNVPDNRGKSSKINTEMVRQITEKAKSHKALGKRIRIKQFAAGLKDEGINLSAKKVEEILIANDLYKACTRKKRPAFYQSLSRRIPNGLVSLDGSELTIWLGDTPYRFNVELAVDVVTFAHTAFGIADAETTDQVIKVLECHRKSWGVPVGVLHDHGSANISAEAQQYLDQLGIKSVPVGPGNPKGNGTDEGAFSQMKKVLGKIRLDVSSSKALARSVLNALISVYVHMRNRLPVKKAILHPAQHMAMPISDELRSQERQELDRHVAKRTSDEETREKLDRLNWVIRHHGLDVSVEVLNRAQRSIKAYDLKAIGETETAFIKAVNRKSERRNLSYFFGILKNIQQQHDDDAKQQYCRKRYNYEVMLKLKRRQSEQPAPPSIDNVVAMLEKAVTVKVRFVKELAIRKAREWTQQLMESYRYQGSINKKVEDALGNMKHLSIDQKQTAWELFCQFLNNKNVESSVTLAS